MVMVMVVVIEGLEWGWGLGGIFHTAGDFAHGSTKMYGRRRVTCFTTVTSSETEISEV